jgi:hypothetical protein
MNHQYSKIQKENSHLNVEKAFNKNKVIQSKIFDEERALYNQQNTDIINCVFSGENDGESCLKESKSIYISGSFFNLRYPLWHVYTFEIKNSTITDQARAPIWYSRNGEVNQLIVEAAKCFRECENIRVMNSEIISEEAFWMSNNIIISQTKFIGQYLLLKSNQVSIHHSTLKGKYGLQYMTDVMIEDSYLETKDAFWHSENVTVKNSKINGAYLGWYSKNLTLINCEIEGTQPFCYCDQLKLINCKMINCDLAFENSSVIAEIDGAILSVKNPKSGSITADKIEHYINENPNCNDLIIKTKEEKK